MYTATYVQDQIQTMKLRNESKANIIRTTAELCLDWPYVWASNGEMCTPAWRQNRIPYCKEQKYVDMIRNNCPVFNDNASTCAECKWNGCRCFDCQGFVHWLLEQVDVPLYGGGATTQWETTSNWVAKGTIDTIPRGLVCAVYKRKENKMSHAGMYMGDNNGGIIHCSTIVKRGNVYTDKPAWTHWGIPKGLYSIETLKRAGINVDENNNIPTFRRGNTGDMVRQIQNILNQKLNTNITVDGIFGSKTESAVKEFQKKNNLVADGVVGKKTLEKLGLVAANIIPKEIYNDNINYIVVSNLNTTELLEKVNKLKERVEQALRQLEKLSY